MLDTLVSIIIPLYNGDKFIEATINSCLNQSYKNIEVIIVDDCSSDSSVKICSKFNDKRVHFYKNDINSGILSTANKGSVHADGDYYIFLGHDDILKKDHVKELIKDIDENISFVHCNSDLIDSEGNIIGVGANDNKQEKWTKHIKISLIFRNVVHSTGALINAKIFQDVGRFDLDFRNYGEWLLWIKLANKGAVVYSNRIRALYRRHTTNITNTFKEPELNDELQEYYNLCRLNALNNIRSKLLKIAIRIYLLYFVPKVKQTFRFLAIKRRRILELKFSNTIDLLLNRGKCVHWSDNRENKYNFGDAINPVLFNYLFEDRAISNRKTINIFNKQTYYFIGSTLDNLKRRNSIICGAGFLHGDVVFKKKPKKIIGVRGPLTRDILLKSKVNCPEVFCDPVLILPKILKIDFPEKLFDIGIIPHYCDKNILKKKIINTQFLYNIIDIEEDYKKVVENINRCKYIISSSLHGLIIAHAYGIPAVWIKLSNRVSGNGFKFYDYYYSLGETEVVCFDFSDKDIIDIEKILSEAKRYNVSINIRKYIDQLFKEDLITTDVYNKLIL